MERGEFFHLLCFFMQKDLIGIFLPEEIMFIRSVVDWTDQAAGFAGCFRFAVENAEPDFSMGHAVPDIFE